jgi:hypothetical protein
MLLKFSIFTTRMSGGLLKLLPRAARYFARAGAAVVIAGGAAVAINGLSDEPITVGPRGGGEEELPPLNDIPPLPPCSFPRPKVEGPPYVKQPKPKKRPPRLIPGHYQPPYSPPNHDPIAPGSPHHGPPAPPPSEAGDPADDEDPLGGPGDPWGPDDDEDREPEPGRPRPRKIWPPDYPEPPMEDELYEIWRDWIRLFRTWRHDTIVTLQKLQHDAPEDEAQALKKRMKNIIEEIRNKPKKSYPIAELEQDIKAWDDILGSVSGFCRGMPWADTLKKDVDSERLVLRGLYNRLEKVILKEIEELQKTQWVSHDFPGDPAPL